MGPFLSFFDAIESAISSFNIFSDLLDIALVSFLIYKLIILVRDTRAVQLLKGIVLLVIFYILSAQFDLRTLTFILKNIFQVGIISLVILFQPELRRMLEKVGRTQVSAFHVFNIEGTEKKTEVWFNAIRAICETVEDLSSTKTGALIVIEKTTRLGEQIASGVYLDSHITQELLLNIFFVNTPLHDGAVIVRDGRIQAASCFLPKPQSEENIASTLGSRHRAAIGISEISDAITIVVSEENGTISITEDGNLTRNFTKETLKQFLVEKLVPKVVTKKSVEDKPKKKSTPKKDKQKNKTKVQKNEQDDDSSKDKDCKDKDSNTKIEENSTDKTDKDKDTGSNNQPKSNKNKNKNKKTKK